MLEVSTFERIYQIVLQIPHGQVATYGQIAALAGCNARVVGYALAAVPEHTDIPWHRVVNAQGKISLPGDAHDRQKERLLSEKIKFNKRDKIDLSTYQWSV